MRACDGYGMGFTFAKYRPNLKLWVTKAVSDEMLLARYLINTQTRPVRVPSLWNVGDIFIQGIHPVLMFEEKL